MIACCIPSRGLIHSRTVQGILANVLGVDELGFYFSHGYPIPDSHNIIIEEAIADKPDYIWLVEDDNQLPHGILKQLLKAKADIAVADYPVRKSKHSVTYINNKFQYAGLGCVLIKPSVFNKIGRPYFRTDIEYVVGEDGLTPTEAIMGNHGLLDVDFYQRCLQIPSISIKIISMTAGHYYLKEPKLPKFGNDTGNQYVVETWKF